MTANEIIKNVWIGDIDDARVWKGNKICVLEKYPVDYTQREHSLLIPILSRVVENVTPTNKREMIKDEDAQVLMENIDLVSTIIQNHIMEGEKVLVHCIGGMERSPLAVTWYLHRNAGVPVTDAFDYVKTKRPQALNRIQWLNISYDEL